MKILAEIERRVTLLPGDVVTIKHNEETILTHPVTETMHCTHAAVIELEGELGYERAIGGVFGRKV